MKRSGTEGFELTARPWLRRLLVSRWPQWSLMAVALAFFAYVVLAGFFGTPVGNRNIAITLVWIAWWAALVLVLVPVGGRLWCSICPIPAPGEWLQRGGLMASDGRRTRGLKRRWPRRLRSLWLQNAGFLALALFSAVILTTPRVTAWVLLGLVLLAVAVSLVFERRAFCRYLCPVGGFIGIYALAAPLALRVRDPDVCRTHPTKDCYRGNAQGFGCPWMTYPGTLDRNADCGLCLECLRTCPLDNVTVVLQPLGADLGPRRGRPPLSIDEAYKGFILLAAALVYGAVMMGPWSALKDAAFQVGSGPWFLYAAGLLLLALLLLPGLYLLAAWIGDRLARRPAGGLRRGFLLAATGLIPLGLGGWIAFSLGFLFANGSYVLSTLSDPLGWGWDLLGTAGLAWRPALTGLVPALQGAALVAGLAWATRLTSRAFAETTESRRAALRRAAPVLLLQAALGAALMGVML